MNTVNPIKDINKINEMKEYFKRNGMKKELVLFTFGINTGLRISDILNLKWEDVYDNNFKMIKIKEQKTGKTKMFPINKVLKESLKSIMPKEFAPFDYIFKSESNRVKSQNKAWSRAYVWEFINKAAKASGIKEEVGTHTLRKTFGYHAYNNGTSIELIQKIFNHSSSVITLRYIGITQEDINDVYLKVVNL